MTHPTQLWSMHVFECLPFSQRALAYSAWSRDPQHPKLCHVKTSILRTSENCVSLHVWELVSRRAKSNNDSPALHAGFVVLYMKLEWSFSPSYGFLHELLLCARGTSSCMYLQKSREYSVSITIHCAEHNFKIAVQTKEKNTGGFGKLCSGRCRICICLVLASVRYQKVSIFPNYDAWMLLSDSMAPLVLNNKRQHVCRTKHVQVNLGRCSGIRKHRFPPMEKCTNLIKACEVAVSRFTPGSIHSIFLGSRSSESYI
jgi:hypothetical protein